MRGSAVTGYARVAGFRSGLGRLAWLLFPLLLLLGCDDIERPEPTPRASPERTCWELAETFCGGTGMIVWETVLRERGTCEIRCTDDAWKDLDIHTPAPTPQPPPTKEQG